MSPLNRMKFGNNGSYPPPLSFSQTLRKKKQKSGFCWQKKGEQT